MQNVTPFDVDKVTDYSKLVEQFGGTPFDKELFKRFQSLTGVEIPVCYQHFIISHREFDKILDAYEKKEPFYLYTGRGPSSENMHLGKIKNTVYYEYSR